MHASGVLLGYPMSSIGAVGAALLGVGLAWVLPIAMIRGPLLGLAGEALVLGLVRINGRTLLDIALTRARFDARRRAGHTYALPHIPEIGVTR